MIPPSDTRVNKQTVARADIQETEAGGAAIAASSETPAQDSQPPATHAKGSGPRPAQKPEVQVPASGPIGRLTLKIKEKKARQEVKQTQEGRESDRPEAAFSNERFREVWEQLAASHKEDSLGLFLALTRHKPKLLADGVIMVSVDNAIQEEVVMEKTPELLGVLHRELGNYSLLIQTRIARGKSGQKAYLPKEKLQKLMEKNPGLQKFRRELGLDLIY